MAAPASPAAAPSPGIAPMPGVAAQRAPPFILPGEHFAAALVFLVAGAVGLVLVAGQLAAGSYPALRVIAVAHLFTLGWITTSIMGALYQFLPVALGQPIRSVRLAHVSFALYAPGLALFVGGLVTGVMPAMLAGAATFGTGVLLFVGNLTATLRRAERRDVSWWALALATFFLTTTLLVGWLLAGNLRWGYLGGGRYGAVGVHLHIAIAGWVLPVMVGVAHRLLPMFLLSHGAGERFAKISVALLGAGAGVLAVLHHLPPLISRWLPAVLIAGGLLSFLVQARSFYRRRHRPVLDPGMRLAAVSLALLGVALVLAAPVVLGAAAPRLATAYVLLVVLAISLFVAAHYYKIVPFLVWYHRFGPLAGRARVPSVAQLYSARAAKAAGALLFAGACMLAIAIGAGSAAFARMAALVFASGATVEAIQMLGLARRKP